MIVRVYHSCLSVFTTSDRSGQTRQAIVQNAAFDNEKHSSRHLREDGSITQIHLPNERQLDWGSLLFAVLGVRWRSWCPLRWSACRFSSLQTQLSLQHPNQNGDRFWMSLAVECDGGVDGPIHTENAPRG